MAEYIRREDALDCLKRYPTGKYAGENLYCAEIRAAADDINDLPVADVVSVVRCKDCKFCDDAYCYDGRKLEDFYHCNWLDEVVGKDDFCSHGEKEE